MVPNVIPAGLGFDDSNGALHAVLLIGVRLTHGTMKRYVDLVVLVQHVSVRHTIQMSFSGF